MNNLKAWCVCLDMSITDHQIIKNVAALAQKFTPSVIHFIYVASKPDIPDEVLQDIPDLQIPELTSYQSKMEEMISKHLPNQSNIEIHLKEGNLIATLLRFSNDTDCDLLIVGKKGDGNGIVGKKLARKAPCSILFVPETAKNEINSILFPTDFSRYSDLALNIGHNIAQKFEGCELDVVHIYKDATKYLYRAYETAYEVNHAVSQKPIIDEKLAKYAKHKLSEYLKPVKKNGVMIHQHTSGIGRGEEIGDAILRWSDKKKPDMIVIGAKGKSSTAATLLGSVSEHVYTRETNSLILVMKVKGENKSLLKLLLGR